MSQAVWPILLTVGAGVLLRFNLWRALLCLRPQSLRLEWDGWADGFKSLPEPLEAIARELRAEGFQPLGVRTEQPPLGPVRRLWELSHPEAQVFATLYLSARSELRFYLLTPLTRGGFVLSANHRRPPGDEARGYFSSGLEGVTPSRLLRAHQRRLSGLQPEGSFTYGEREAAARGWLERFGRFELRQKNVRGLLWTLTAWVLVACALSGV